MSEKYPVALFNGVIITADGKYVISALSEEKAKELVDEYGFISAIGHDATAKILSGILQKEVKKNRIQYRQAPTQFAIALKLNKRPKEGVVLGVEEMLEIGYRLKLIERVE
ncbi:MAG: STIV orfB116 family protein [Clostridia bacterium]